ncbi:MAG: AmmeMemoRadiSam system protein B, partial [Thermodesulfobacteriota bacterium]|nr:AmmeMemoRadiSam system protein B [Thermodesulfobacteriota bacterium]
MMTIRMAALSIFLLLALPTASLHADAKIGSSTRRAAVAGLFYPGQPEALRDTVVKQLKEAGGATVAGRIRGLVSPHAGYVYSGIVAAAGYRQVDPSFKT